MSRHHVRLQANSWTGRDRGEAMLRETYDLAPEVETIVSMLRS